MADAGTTFGSCCESLKETMSEEDFTPLVSVGDDGILYMSVGMIDVENDEPEMVDFPVMFCPFCGKGLQTQQEIEAKSVAKS